MKRVERWPRFALLVVAIVAGGLFGAPLLAAPQRPLTEGGPTAAGAPDASGPASSSPAAASPASSATGSAKPAPTRSAKPSSPPKSSKPATSSKTPAPRASERLPPRPAAPSAAAGADGWFVPVPVQRRTASATVAVKAALDARLERLRAKAGIPGVSASIIFPDGSIWQGSAGLADVKRKRPVTPETAFPVASISKTFTAALTLALAHEGRLELDRPAVSYLPTLPIDRAITIRQLLDHRSGLRDYFMDRRIDKALLSKPAAVWDPARSLSFVDKPYGKPGIAFHYSNTNYLVLGMIAEAVGDGTVAEQLRERFLDPLALEHTWYQAVEEPRAAISHAYRFPGTSVKLRPIDLSDGTAISPFTSVVTAAGGAGSIASTSLDLARWARALYNGAALDDTSRAEMVADALPTALYAPAASYGLGVQLVQVGDELALGHSGRFVGARAAFRWIPGEQLAVAVLTNQSRTDPNRLVADLVKLALRPNADCINCPLR